MNNGIFNKLNAVCAAFLLLAGCSFRESSGGDLGTAAEDGLSGGAVRIVRGALALRGGVPSSVAAVPSESSARTALPAVPSGSAVYEVEAYADGVLYGTAPVKKEGGAWFFEIALPVGAGTYRLDAAGTLDGRRILQGSREFDFEGQDAICIELFPMQGGEGSISLAVQKEAGTLCGSATSVLLMMYGFDAVEAPFSGSSAAISVDSVSSGAYQAVILVLAGGSVLYRCCETINVFDNLSTDRWLNSGNSPYLSENSDGTARFLLTERLLEESAAACGSSAATFFVSGAGGYDSTGISGGTAPDDGNSGAYNAPLKTVSAAVKKRAPGMNRCVIYVDGATEEAEGIAIEGGCVVTILPLSAAGGAAKIAPADSLSTRLITVGDGSSLVMERVVLDGNGLEASGIYCGAGSSLSLDSCEIRRFHDSAVYISSPSASAAVVLRDCAIESCRASNSGGAIYNDGGTLSVYGGTISSCTAASYGGAICTAGSAEIADLKIARCSATDADGKGGALSVFSGSKAAISGACISGCRADGDGGGIYIGSGASLTAVDTTVEDNSGDAGGGIYCAGTGSTVEISGCTISNCAASEQGGGIWTSKKAAALADTTVSSCTAPEGAGIYVGDGGTISVSGGTKLDSASGVRLPGDEKPIRISGALTAGSLVASISFDALAADAEGRLVVDVGGGAASGDDVLKFKVDNAGGYYIDKEGRLRSIGRVLEDASSGDTVEIVLPEGGLDLPNQIVKSGVTLHLKGFGGGSTLNRQDREGAMIETNGGSIIIDEGVTLDGGGDRLGNAGKAVVQVTDGTLTLYGTITNGMNGTQAGVNLAGSSTFVMEDGAAITGCVDDEHWGIGSAVGIFGGSTFTMNGGTISGNKAAHMPGVRVGAGGTFIMNGGTITGNDATVDGSSEENRGKGAGVSVCEEDADDGKARFEWNGGAISGNMAYRHPKDIFVEGVCELKIAVPVPLPPDCENNFDEYERCMIQ